MNNDNVIKNFKKLSDIFDKPYKINFKGLSFGRERFTFITYLYFVYHEEKICIKHIVNTIENIENIEQCAYKALNNCEMYYLPTENIKINFELSDNEILFKDNNINILVYYDSTFFTRDGLTNKKIRKATTSEFIREINNE